MTTSVVPATPAPGSLPLGQLTLDLLQHLVGHHGAQDWPRRPDSRPPGDSQNWPWKPQKRLNIKVGRLKPACIMPVAALLRLRCSIERRPTPRAWQKHHCPHSWGCNHAACGVNIGAARCVTVHRTIARAIAAVSNDDAQQAPASAARAACRSKPPRQTMPAAFHAQHLCADQAQAPSLPVQPAFMPSLDQFSSVRTHQHLMPKCNATTPALRL